MAGTDTNWDGQNWSNKNDDQLEAEENRQLEKEEGHRKKMMHHSEKFCEQFNTYSKEQCNKTFGQINKFMKADIKGDILDDIQEDKQDDMLEALKTDNQFYKDGHCRPRHNYASKKWELWNKKSGAETKTGDDEDYEDLVARAASWCKQNKPSSKYVSVWSDYGFRCYNTCGSKQQSGSCL